MPFYTEIYIGDDGQLHNADGSLVNPPPDAVSGAGSVEGSPNEQEPDADADDTQGLPPSPASQGSHGAGSSYSVSYQGTPQVARDKFNKGLQGDWAYDRAQGAAEYKSLVAPSEATAQQQEQQVISDDDMANAPTSYQATKDKLVAQARDQKYMADLQAGMIEQERQAQAAAKTVTDHAMAQYAAQVQAYQAMKVNPGELWHQMSNGMRAETLAAVFAHNFLAAKGIQTTAMDTINRAIDQNIQAQIENINKQGKTVDHFGQLYNMVVSQSATDAEMRARLRGMMLAQAENMVNADLMQYDAPIAQAKAVETRLAFQQAQNENAREIYEHVQARVQNAMQMDLSRRNAELSASMEARRIAESKREFDEANKPKAPDVGGAIGKARESVYFDIDPTSPNFGKPQGMILEGTSPQDRYKIRDVGAKAMGVMQEVKALRDATAKMEPTYGPNWGSQALTTQDQKRVKALQARVALMLAAEENRGRPSDKDQDAAKQYVPLDTITTYGDVDQVINDLLILTKQEYNNTTAGQVRNFSTDFGTGLPEEALLGDTTALTPAEGGTYQTEANTWGAPEVKSQVDQDMENVQAPNPTENHGVLTERSRVDDLNTLVDDAIRSAKDSGNTADVQKAYDFIFDAMYQAADQDNPDGYLQDWGGVDFLDGLQSQLIAAGAKRPDDTETAIRNLKRGQKTPKRDEAVKFDQSPTPADNERMGD